MFCDQCGGPLQSGMTSCARCGKTVLGLIELRRSRVREHIRLVGICGWPIRRCTWRWESVAIVVAKYFR